MNKRRRFSQKFKQQAISLVLDQKQPIVRVAQNLQIGHSTLSKWLFLHKKKAFPKSENQEKKTQCKQYGDNSKQAQLCRNSIFTELVDEQPNEVGFELEYYQAVFRVSKNFDHEVFARCLTILKKVSC